MFDQGSTVHYSPWENEKDRLAVCFPCRKKKYENFGILMRRKVRERDGHIYTQYKVVCPICKNSTEAHRSKQIAITEWEGKNNPEDVLKYRSRTPNIALNRETEVLKGDGFSGLKKSTDKT